MIAESTAYFVADAGAAVCASSRTSRLLLRFLSPKKWTSGSLTSGRRNVWYETMNRLCVDQGLTPKPRSCRRRRTRSRL